MEKSRKRKNISPEGGFHDVPRYVHPPIYMTEVKSPISLMLLMSSGTYHFLLFQQVVLSSSGLSHHVLCCFFGCPGYTKIAVAAHIWHLS